MKIALIYASSEYDAIMYADEVELDHVRFFAEDTFIGFSDDALASYLAGDMDKEPYLAPFSEVLTLASYGHDDEPFGIADTVEMSF